jgi:DNA-binding transcriptional regulator/RsmH inhibitor MraZ
MNFRGGPVLLLDGKGRITVPTRWRELLVANVDGQMVVAKNPDGYCGLGGTGVTCAIGTGVHAG